MMYAERLPRLNRAIARVNRVGLNRLTHVIAPWAPGWAVVVHRGRKSGHTYRTPLWVFRKDGGFVIALTYGQRTQWLSNVLAAGGCDLETRGKRYRVTSPNVYKDKTRKDMPAVIRVALRLLGVDDFLSLEVESVSPRVAAPTRCRTSQSILEGGHSGRSVPRSRSSAECDPAGRKIMKT